MTDEEAARLRAQVQEATRVLSGSYTISQQRQVALTEEYAETFTAAVERLLIERALLLQIVQAVAAYPEYAGQDLQLMILRAGARALLGAEGKQP